MAQRAKMRIQEQGLVWKLEIVKIQCFLPHRLRLREKELNAAAVVKDVPAATDEKDEKQHKLWNSRSLVLARTLLDFPGETALEE